MKVLSAGAFVRTLMDIVPGFEAQSGCMLAVSKDTVGALVRRITAGESFDVVIVSDAALDGLIAEGRVIAGSARAVARVGVGVMVRAGAARRDVSTVAAFRQAVLDAKSIAYIDPDSGGSSGIYVAGLLQRLGVSEAVRAKTRLKQGGHVADLIAAGEAELGIHQISEILPNEQVTLIGPLPAEIQSYTTYAAGVSAECNAPADAEALIAALLSPAVTALMQARGMDRPVTDAKRKSARSEAGAFG